MQVKGSYRARFVLLPRVSEPKLNRYLLTFRSVAIAGDIHTLYKQLSLILFKVRNMCNKSAIPQISQMSDNESINRKPHKKSNFEEETIKF